MKGPRLLIRNDARHRTRETLGAARSKERWTGNASQRIELAEHSCSTWRQSLHGKHWRQQWPEPCYNTNSPWKLTCSQADSSVPIVRLTGITQLEMTKNIHVSQETQSAKGRHGACAQRNALQTLYFLSGDKKLKYNILDFVTFLA